MKHVGLDGSDDGLLTIAIRARALGSAFVTGLPADGGSFVLEARAPVDGRVSFRSVLVLRRITPGEVARLMDLEDARAEGRVPPRAALELAEVRGVHGNPMHCLPMDPVSGVRFIVPYRRLLPPQRCHHSFV